MKKFAIALVGLTFVLLIIGGLVSATDSGLACPDWPTCHGTFLPAMVGGVRFEYTHRTVASSVGLCTVILCVLAWRRRKTEPAMAKLAAGAVGLVIFQGLLGAVTVKLELPPQVSITHLATSMIFFSLTVVMAWTAVATENPRSKLQGSPPGGVMPPRPKGRGIVTGATVAVYAQIVLGAAVRHTRSGLACTDLPLCQGALFPSGGHAGVQIHMAHRLLGVIAAALLVAACARVYQAGAGGRSGRALAMAAPIMVVVQIALGAGIILSWRNLYVMTAHQALGAAILATMISLWMLTRESPEAATERLHEASSLPEVVEAQA